MGKWEGALENMVKDFWAGRRVLVTGGAGFIGYALARKLLASGAKVSILDIRPLPPYATKEEKKKFHFVRGSVTSEKTVGAILKSKKIQTVFHLAAEAIVDRALHDPENALDSNIRGTWVLLESVRQSRGVEDIVIASSDHVYGTDAKPPFHESSPLGGSSPYDISKSCTDLIAKMYAKTFGLPIVIARCGNVFGPGDMNWTRLIPDALRSLSSGKPLQLRSNGKFSRDYVYIDDVVDAYIALARNLRKKNLHGEAFNFAFGKPLSVKAVLRHIKEGAGRSVPFTIANTARHEIKSLHLDSTKAKRILSWAPSVSREEGFRRTIAWYADFFS